MNKEKGSFSFTVRTVFALILIYVILMVAATFFYADAYAERVFEKTRSQAVKIAGGTAYLCGRQSPKCGVRGRI